MAPCVLDRMHWFEVPTGAMGFVVVATLILFTLSMPRLGNALARKLKLGDYATMAIALGLGNAFFLAPVVIFGNLARNSHIGFIASFFLAAGFYAFYRRHPWPQLFPKHSRRAFVFTIVTCTTIIGLLAFRYPMFDEDLLLGHEALTRQVARGSFPPYIMWAPSEPFRYHWGFDVLTAAVLQVLPVTTSTAIDIVSIFLAITLAWTAAAVVEDLGGWAPGGIWAVFFGSGLAVWVFLFWDNASPGCFNSFGGCGFGMLNTQLVYFFQHAVSLGAPLFFVFLLLIPRLDQVRQAPELPAFLLLLLVSLGVGQTVFFALGLLSALSACVFWWRGEGKIAYPIYIALIALSFWVASVDGSMFTHSDFFEPTSRLVKVRDTFGILGRSPRWELLFWISCLGLQILMIPLFVWDGFRRKSAGVLMGTAFGIGGILVAVLFRYERTWDIGKFPSAAAYVLSVLCVAVVHRGLMRQGKLWMLARGTFWALLLGTGMLNAVWFLWPTRLPGMIRIHPGEVPFPANVRAAAHWIVSRPYKDEQMIFAGDPRSNLELSVAGGLSVAYTNKHMLGTGFIANRVAPFMNLYKSIRTGLDSDEITKRGIHWVLTSGEDEEKMSVQAKEKLYNPKSFQLVKVFPDENDSKTLKLWWNQRFQLPDGWIEN